MASNDDIMKKMSVLVDMVSRLSSEVERLSTLEPIFNETHRVSQEISTLLHFVINTNKKSSNDVTLPSKPKSKSSNTQQSKKNVFNRRNVFF